MFAVCFEMDIVKSWGRRVAANFHQYVWRGEHILSNISRCMISSTKINGAVPF